MTPKVLLIEDDAPFRKALAHTLGSNGYAALEAGTGKAGVSKAREEGPVLVILDLILPGMHGLEVCQLLKQSPDTAGIPILVLTANDAEGQEIACLDMGADDYLTKPVRKERLLARCRALLRRSGAVAEGPESLRLGPLALDHGRKLVSFDGREYPHLTPKEFELLFDLARHNPEPRARETLYREVWGADPPSDQALRTVEVHVRRLRLKLGWKSDQWLVTVTGRGYALRPS
ncbi:MAG: response regulator transcription factor [Elusimicrobia bacterium]|nr:response regulator transcription factor [Elusimicrobiota bacterium]